MKKRSIEIDTRSWLARAVLNAKANGGYYCEPPMYRHIRRRPDTWLAKRRAKLLEKSNGD